MKGATGLARIPVIVAVLVVAAGGASLQGRLSTSDELAAVSAAPAPEGEVPFIGEMTVTASRVGS